jgi:hypothetical protein
MMECSCVEEKRLRSAVQEHPKTHQQVVAGSTYPLPQYRLPQPEITLYVGKNLLPRLPHFETSRDHSFDRRLDRTSRDLARQNGNLCCGLLGPLFLARFAEELGDGVHDEKVGLVVLLSTVST